MGYVLNSLNKRGLEAKEGITERQQIKTAIMENDSLGLEEGLLSIVQQNEEMDRSGST